MQSLFGSAGLPLNGCTFGECVRQSVIDTSDNHTNSSSSNNSGKALSGGVVAGLAVVGALILLALALFVIGYIRQTRARKFGFGAGKAERSGGIRVEWNSVTYLVPSADGARGWTEGLRRRQKQGWSNDKVVLDEVSGHVNPGQIMAVLGPSGK